MKRLPRLIEQIDTLSRLWRHPGRSPEEIAAFRDRKLRVLVAHAWAEVPFYRAKLAAAGVGPDEIRGVGDLHRLPIITKRELQTRPAGETVARGVRVGSLVRRYTAGSTGEPGLVRRSSFENHLLNQFRLRALAGCGLRLRDRLAHVSAPDMPGDYKPRWPGMLREAAGIHRTASIDCLRSPEEVARDLVAARPDVVVGYASTLVEVVEPWRAAGGAERPPRLIFCGGEVMTPVLRARVRGGFGARVIETYGCNEANLLAWQCGESEDLHLCDDGVIVEVLRDGQHPARPGESGEVVITVLHSYAAPYLRFRLDDIAVAGESRCGCGAPFATLRAVEGRVMDALVLPGGRVMHHWELLPKSFWGMPWHRLYQVVQEAPDRVVLRVVADGEPPGEDLELLRRSVLDKLRGSAHFRIDFIDELERTRSGKTRSCISNVDRVLRPPCGPAPPALPGA